MSEDIQAQPSRDTRYPFVTRCIHWKPNAIDPATGYRIVASYSYRFMRARSARHAQSVLLADNKDPNFTPSLTYGLRPQLPAPVAQCFMRNGWNIANGEAARLSKRRYLLPGHLWYLTLQSGIVVGEWRRARSPNEHEVTLPNVGDIVVPSTALLLPCYG